MTPLEIFEYKRRWMQTTDFSVEVNEDFDFTGKHWCKENLEQHQWHFIRFSDMYAHMFCFERQEDMDRFEKFYEGKDAQ